MNGPYDYTSDQIDFFIQDGMIGNYMLGKVEDTAFVVQYVGRADADLNAELKQRLGRGYSKFKFSFAGSIREAFERQCLDYHEFGGKVDLDNEQHPIRPIGMPNLKCSLFGCRELRRT